MQINLKRQVDNLKNTNIYTIFKEAVTNSIHANSTKINIYLNYEEDLFPLAGNDIKKIRIEDNGEGFTQNNVDSFLEYGSEYKANLGCKGIGRVTFLKFFRIISIESFLKDNSQRVNINFSENFDKNNISHDVSDNLSENKTILKFENAIGNSQTIAINTLKDELYTYLLPLLFLKKKSDGEDISIQIFGGDNLEASILTEKLPHFSEESFYIKDTKKQNIKYTLSYYIEESKQESLEGYYCANSLTVCEFISKKVFINKISNYKIIFLLESSFLDEKVNNTRDDFSISLNKEDRLYGDFSWNKINEKLQEVIAKILYNKFPDLKNKNKRIAAQIREENLHLVDYLCNINYLGGLIDKDSIIKKAEKKFLKAKSEFRKALEQDVYSNKEIANKASNLAGKELIEYVLMRSNIITQLEILSSNNERKEELLHELIIPKGVDDTQGTNIIPLKKNNVWLIDDKFMSYNYIASDKTIATFLKNSSQEKISNRDRPDIAIHFESQNNNNNAIIIELKALGSDKKFDGLKQLREYARSLGETKELSNIWYYLITNIDDDFGQALISDDYLKLFSTHEKYYFKYYKIQNIYIYVISEESLISDAKARNKAFLDIVKNNLPNEE